MQLSTRMSLMLCCQAKPQILSKFTFTASKSTITRIVRGLAQKPLLSQSINSNWRSPRRKRQKYILHYMMLKEFILINQGQSGERQQSSEVNMKDNMKICLMRLLPMVN